MKRIENDDIPGNLFKVYKPKSENENGQTVVDEEGQETKNNDYFKVLKVGNFKRI